MPVVIPKDEFIPIAGKYVNGLLSSICEEPVMLAPDPQPHTVRIVAKLARVDFEAIKYSDVYVSIQKIVGRLGEHHVDPATRKPHTAEFKLYDPYFDSLDFKPGGS